MKRPAQFLSVALACWLVATAAHSQNLSVAENFERLVAQEDTDGDRKITVHDRVTPFYLRATNGATVLVVTNVYELSVLLQELKRAEDARGLNVSQESLRLNENVVDRTHRLIGEFYWDALTRRIDTAHVDEVARDPKVRSKDDTIYVPGADLAAVSYFKSVERAAAAQKRSPALKVVALPAPEKISGAFVRNLDGSHGILALALQTNAVGTVSGVPYVVPGGRFNELYCWDSYFITLGLLADRRADLARGMADNLLYEMQYYRKVPNANRSYYLTRSQPPFLTSIVRAVYESGAGDKAWLAAALKTALEEYANVWLGRDRLVKIGRHELSRYYDEGDGPCPEVEPGHYDEKIRLWLELIKPANPNLPLTPYRFLNEYLYCGVAGNLKADGMTLNEFFKHDRAVRESGHDTTHRFDDRTADFVSVDLNALLYKYETDFADLIEQQFGGDLPELGAQFRDAKVWRQRAADRKKAMLELMWDKQQGYFFDYDFVNRQRSTYISATGLWPLWAKMFNAINPDELIRAKRTAAFACEKLEQTAGLSATARESVETARRHDSRQWDYPFGWAPHQMLAWQGLINYGLDADASRLAYRWVYCIAKNAHDFNGTIPEKFNVVTGSHDVFVEYGNVGTKFDYITTEGFGWMNASFEVGSNYLSPDQRKELKEFKVPPTN